MGEKEVVQNTEFEYNDGLGDMLCDKEKEEFGWTKLIMTILLILTVGVLFFIFSFNLGKKIIHKKDVSRRHIEKFSRDDISARIHAIESEKKRMIKKIETDLAKSDHSQSVVQPKMAAVHTANKMPEKATSIAPAMCPTASVKSAKQEVKKVQPVVEQKKTAEKMVECPKPKPKVRKLSEVQKVHQTPVATVSKAVYPYKIIVGTFESSQNAEQLMKQLQAKGIDACTWISTAKDQRKQHHVQVGAFKTYKSASQWLKSLEAKGIQGYILKK